MILDTIPIIKRQIAESLRISEGILYYKSNLDSKDLKVKNDLEKQYEIDALLKQAFNSEEIQNYKVIFSDIFEFKLVDNGMIERFIGSFKHTVVERR